MIDPGLSGTVALITGANHGIGAATAQALARHCVAVFITFLRFPVSTPTTPLESEVPGEAHYRRQQARSADEVVAAIERAGGRAAAWEADLADPATIPALFDRAEAAFGPVQILVNNADHCTPDTFLPERARSGDHPSVTWYRHNAIGVAELDRHFVVNGRAPALLIAEFAGRHVARGADWGRIVNLSTDGAAAFAGEVSYGASKHALESYSRAAAIELGPFGITVNVVSPGPTQTGWITAESEAQTVPRIPLRRVGAPDDIADAIVFFASEQARWITGQLLYVGGGHRMPL